MTDPTRADATRVRGLVDPADGPAAIAVDIGGSGVRAARITGSGREGAVHRQPLVLDLPSDRILSLIRDVIVAVGRDARDVGLTIAIPAFVDAAGAVCFCVNLPGLNGVVLSSCFSDLAPAAGAVAVVPDVTAAAVAEARLGAGRGAARFLCVAIGTGANAAMTVNGRPLETVAGCLGDAGHVVVDPEGPTCACGGVGCLEAIASGAALARDGRHYGFADAAEVVQAAYAGHDAARRLLTRAGIMLGRAIATWSAMLWPERVAVAGGISAAGDLLLDPARSELRRVGVPYLTESVRIVPAVLGSEAVLVGAGLCGLAAGTYGDAL
jgi:glucokinase